MFHPPSDPQHVHVAAANQVVRYPYRNGDRKARAPAQVIIPNIPTSRHWTRDLAVSRDGRIFVSIGSASNVAATRDLAGVVELGGEDRIQGHPRPYGKR